MLIRAAATTLASFLQRMRCALWNRIRRLLLPYLLRRSRRIYPRIQSNVIRLTRNTVVKSGVASQIFAEALATRYVSQHTSIPVPAVYDFWEISGGRAYMIMEYMDGQRLDRQWRQLSDSQRTAIFRILRDYVQELRDLPQPQPDGWIGSVVGLASFDYRVSPGSLFGPFPNECAYNDWRVSTFSFFANQHPPTGNRLKELRKTMRDDHRIKFTHGDISPRNILVNIESDGPDGVSVVALLDWEQAGWRPEYWEAVKFMHGTRSGSDWAVLGRRELVPGYDTQLAVEIELLLISGPP